MRRFKTKLLRMGKATQKIVELPGSFGSPGEAENDKSVTGGSLQLSAAHVLLGRLNSVIDADETE